MRHHLSDSGVRLPSGSSRLPTFAGATRPRPLRIAQIVPDCLPNATRPLILADPRYAHFTSP
jgi:hypothetical protein